MAIEEFVLGEDEEITGEDPGEIQQTDEELDAIAEKLPETPPEEPEAPPEEPPPPQPAYDPNQARLAELQQQMVETQKRQQSIQEQIVAAQRQAQQQAHQPQTIQRPEDHPDWPKEEDWAKNPTRAAANLNRIQTEFNNAQLRAEIKRREEAWAHQAYQTQQQQQHMAQIQAAQRKSLNSVVQIYPDMADQNSQHYQIANALFKDPQNNLKYQPHGVFAASSMAAAFLQAVNAAKEGEQVKKDSRAAAVKKGAMTGSGKKPKPTQTTELTAEEKDLCKDFGLSHEAYAKAKAGQGI